MICWAEVGTGSLHRRQGIILLGRNAAAKVQLQQPKAWAQAACGLYREASAFAVVGGLCCVGEPGGRSQRNLAAFKPCWGLLARHARRAGTFTIHHCLQIVGNAEKHSCATLNSNATACILTILSWHSGTTYSRR